MGDVNDKEKVRPQVRANGVAVCAHLGIGADDEQAKLARDRLARSLASYRGAIDMSDRADATAARV